MQMAVCLPIQSNPRVLVSIGMFNTFRVCVRSFLCFSKLWVVVKWALFEMIKMVRNRVLFAISKALGFIFQSKRSQ